MKIERFISFGPWLFMRIMRNDMINVARECV